MISIVDVKALNRAVKVLQGAVDLAIRRVAVDANLYQMGVCDNPTARNAWKQRQELRQAIKLVQELVESLVPGKLECLTDDPAGQPSRAQGVYSSTACEREG